MFMPVVLGLSEVIKTPKATYDVVSGGTGSKRVITGAYAHAALSVAQIALALGLIALVVLGASPRAIRSRA